MNTENKLENPDDRFAFNIFVKALHSILSLEEGIVVEYENKWYIVNKFKDEETSEILLGIIDNPIFDDGESIVNGSLVWLDKEKPEIERHKDEESKIKSRS